MWNPETNCVPPSLNWKLQCCWNGHSPFFRYNPQEAFCCPDGTVKKYIENCGEDTLDTTPDPYTTVPYAGGGGYGK